jgi:hypothetical protein
VHIAHRDNFSDLGYALRYSQIQGKVPVPGQDHYTGMVDCFQKIVRNEGYVCYHLGWISAVYLESLDRGISRMSLMSG